MEPSVSKENLKTKLTVVMMDLHVILAASG